MRNLAREMSCDMPGGKLERAHEFTKMPKKAYKGPPTELDFEKALMFFHAYMYGPLQGKLAPREAARVMGLARATSCLCGRVRAYEPLGGTFAY
jgi:hypothetical protein